MNINSSQFDCDNFIDVFLSAFLPTFCDIVIRQCTTYTHSTDHTLISVIPWPKLDQSEFPSR